MKITLFGLGYVGLVTSLCLANGGHHITGVEISQAKVDKLKLGLLPIIEPGLEELFKSAQTNRTFTCICDAKLALAECDFALVAVPTPTLANGTLNLHIVKDVILKDIIPNLPKGTQRFPIAIRSTILPGTIKTLQSLADQQSPESVVIAHIPEFLREGNAVKDFFDPPYTIIGSSCAQTKELLGEAMSRPSCKTYYVDSNVAEMIKYVSNTFHAAKITFANEIGRMCNILGINSTEVLSLACEDKKLNISTAYMRPGFAYGGSCLPKDLRAIVSEGRYQGQRLNLLESLALSNSEHIAHAHQIILKELAGTGGRNVLFCGITFKPHTDDLRESPALELIQRLAKSEFDIQIYDPLVTPDNLIGANLQYQRLHLPNLSSLLRSDLSAMLKSASLIIFNHGSQQLVNEIVAKSSSPVIDLSGSLRGIISPERFRTII